jgi:hypothetical protein
LEFKMAYSFVKQRGRVAFFKDGEFDHQQFRGHYAFRDPGAYIAQLEEWDREAAEREAEERAARLAVIAAYLAERAERRAAQPEFNF